MTLGTLFTAFNANVSVWVACAALVPVCLSGLALWFAYRARQLYAVYPPPAVRGNVAVARYYGKTSTKAKAVLAASWEAATALTRRSLDRKGVYVERSLLCFTLAVFALSLPLLVHLFHRLPM